MNILTNGLPEYVVINNHSYDINTDFRASIQFEITIQDDELTDEEKVIQSLLLYFPSGIPDEPAEDIFKAIMWFHLCGQEEKKKKVKKENEDEEIESEEPAFSYEHDADLIYAAFLAQYGIDLTKDNLHWWCFRALFKALDPESAIAKIMYYRTVTITSEMSKNEQAFLRKQKKIHALPLSHKEQALQDAIADALLNGGDVSAILNGGGNSHENEGENSGTEDTEQ